MDLKSPSDNIHPIRGGRGIQEAQVWEAADVLLQEGLRPTIELPRPKSPLSAIACQALKEAAGPSGERTGRREPRRREERRGHALAELSASARQSVSDKECQCE